MFNKMLKTKDGSSRFRRWLTKGRLYSLIFLPLIIFVLYLLLCPLCSRYFGGSSASPADNAIDTHENIKTLIRIENDVDDELFDEILSDERLKDEDYSDDDLDEDDTDFNIAAIKLIFSLSASEEDEGAQDKNLAEMNDFNVENISRDDFNKLEAVLLNDLIKEPFNEDDYTQTENDSQDVDKNFNVLKTDLLSNNTVNNQLKQDIAAETKEVFQDEAQNFNEFLKDLLSGAIKEPLKQYAEALTEDSSEDEVQNFNELNIDLLSNPIKEPSIQDAATETDDIFGDDTENTELIKEYDNYNAVLGNSPEEENPSNREIQNLDQLIQSEGKYLVASDEETKSVKPDEKPEVITNDVDEYDSMFGSSFLDGLEFWDFSIPNTFLCPNNGKDLYLMITIHSNADNFEQRQAIRDTWGRIARMEGINYAFILSLAADNHVDNRIKHESDEYRDIILTDLREMKENDAAKSIMFFKWIDRYCSQVKYVFKTNDNVFVNLPLLSEFLQDETTKDDVMYGYLYEGFKPERDPKKLNYVSEKLYDSDVYPNYLASEGYIVPAKYASKLYKTAIVTNYLPMEHIFVTGILAEKLKIPRVDIPLFSSTFPDLPKENQCEIFLYTYVFHPLTPVGLRYFWNDMKKLGFRCANFLKKLSKMIPQDKRMYSDTNEKLLYPLLFGETEENLRK